ncbi:DUF3558 domain-containing protein [Labedaea rhizosphaerae]|uniref:Uncharacterized protein DUF3558 n=1 Tax=Labedaea rhizosphaerae TaxID=598644 RepID=A0A4R6SMH2_LABRH|nr:DUF3558 domain-containing protein [Labedaea rhizosphaerae]TDQ05124.1 uncharacterized protein DUF3558 [Labedaea rhizosphaerae]
MSGRAKAVASVFAAILVVGVVVVVVAVVRTPKSEGTAQAQRTITTTTLATTTTSRLLPPRPRDVDVSGLDPCKALTDEQEKELQYNRGWQSPPIADVDGITGAPNCAYGSAPREFGSLISFVTNANVDVWLTDPEYKTDLPPTKTTVSGFPALQITVPRSAPLPDKCTILVDVHDGQYINVFSSRLAGGGVTGSAAYCQEAKKVAAMVLENAENR